MEAFYSEKKQLVFFTSAKSKRRDFTQIASKTLEFATQHRQLKKAKDSIRTSLAARRICNITGAEMLVVPGKDSRFSNMDRLDMFESVPRLEEITKMCSGRRYD